MSTLKHVDMYKNNKTVRRYSESFKLKVLNELCQGHCSKAQLAKLYGINSYLHPDQTEGIPEVFDIEPRFVIGILS